MNNKIELKEIRHHSKASESYQDVIFNYSGSIMEWSIPIVYRRTGIDLIDSTQEQIEAYVNEVYSACNPSNWDEFRKKQDDFWKLKPNADVTKSYFDTLTSDFTWKSVKSDLPANPNFARRIQDLKEMGYTIATDTKREDKKTGEKCTHILLLPLARGGITGYEIWSTALRQRIVNVLGGNDVYENWDRGSHTLLPDHKFPEIRWDETVRRSSDEIELLSDEEIKHDFQLINNQRNQQKREACRKCFQTNKRPGLFGIKFYSHGDENWPSDVPRTGKQAEKGCIGCGWYDIDDWRNKLNLNLQK